MFLGVGRTRDAQAEGVVEARGVVGAAVALDALREGAGEFEELLVVEEGEGRSGVLERSRRVQALKLSAASKTATAGWGVARQ